MTEKRSSFVAAYRLDGQGGGQMLTHDELAAAWATDASPLWMHLDFTHDDVDRYLNDIAELDENIVEALLEEDTRPRVAHFPGGINTTLRGINLNPGASPEDLISLRVWITANRLITVRRRPLQSILRVREYLDAGEGARTVSELFAGMADAMVDRVGERTHQIDDWLGDLEEKQLEDAPVDSDDITRIRRPLITLRRFMDPQYHCLSQLAEISLFDETGRLWLREAANQLYRYVEDFRAMQERALVMQEQLRNDQDERLNARMYLLAIITTIFLPLGFLTGLLGINVGGIPGADNPWAFTIFVVLVLAIVLLQLLFFRKRHWW
ncbi:zinc transporter ZntB [Kushneria phosphatilytica]|uniref:Zinc transporter ZntB n=1 Tax=Kushneria phosphatilytica TaxID=657387 RepID=A0A1S1NU00_9GAMM|nr:zinc transporter ZntB [Kushneria phosphatilytica]OHV10611.1 zinc transporter ZntB [Kushneria phosphatilytica]QEL11808.1 zinc transporter ZntB [Kushneria phosphatilytica]